ncbi:tubulin binding cofactor C-domain-containing protein [Coniochaeta sp. 2T2.1]|nr:tubulin binding cofactor C-domain-containing protein [Coniochaeta sp. 2T2.1]
MDPKERFYRQFQSSVQALQDQIDQLGSFAAIGGERQDAIENVLSGISRLSNEVADASDYVPAYDQRTYSQTLKSLTEALNTTTAQLAPKSRFQFKKRDATSSPATSDQPDARHMLSSASNAPEPTIAASPLTTEPKQERPSPPPPPTGSETDTAPKEDDVPTQLPTQFFKNYNEELSRPSATSIRKPSFSTARDINLSDHTGLHIILPPSASRATTAGQLTRLKRCVIDMSVPTLSSSSTAKPFASLAMRDIDGCLIVAGRVSGATHITGVRNSVVVVAAGQVRIHECRDVDFYLWCGSRPIIEDCVGVRFAPLPEVYMPDQEERSKNMWDQVDDFKWLKADQSPNWTVLPEEERLREEVWRETVPGRPGAGTEDILREVGVARK